MKIKHNAEPLALRPEAARTLLDRLFAQNLVAFTRRTFETIVPGEHLNLNWHIEAMAFVLDQVMRGKIRRLIITVPPRSLKSIMASVAFPAFVLGRDPTKKIVCVSYSDNLAAKHAIDCRRVLQSDWYKRAFPFSRIGLEKNTETDFMMSRRGGRFATSTGGTLTGRGGDIFVLDDVMKPEEAFSEASRLKIISWIEATLMSRLNDKQKSAIIVIMQRLHVDDVVGVLLEKGGWYHLDLPAIADRDEIIPLYSGGSHHRQVGDVLDEVREPLSVLNELRASMGSMAFSAQYLQRAIAAEGNLIRREWLSYYERAPSKEPRDLIVTSWDTAMKSGQLADFSVGTTWLVKGETYYLLDLVRDRFDFPSLKRAVLAAREKWPGATILIEDKGSGTSLIQQLRYDNVSVIGIKAVEDKVTRLYAVGPMFESGAVKFPQKAFWYADLLAELMAFPQGRHDDQVDSVSQFLRWAAEQRFRQNESCMFIYSVPREDGDNFPYDIQ